MVYRKSVKRLTKVRGRSLKRLIIPEFKYAQVCIRFLYESLIRILRFNKRFNIGK